MQLTINTDLLTAADIEAVDAFLQGGSADPLCALLEQVATDGDPAELNAAQLARVAQRLRLAITEAPAPWSESRMTARSGAPQAAALAALEAQRRLNRGMGG